MGEQFEPEVLAAAKPREFYPEGHPAIAEAEGEVEDTGAYEPLGQLIDVAEEDAPKGDISPRDWLEYDDSQLVVTYETRRGKVLLSALTEKETDVLLRGCRKRSNAADPKSPMRTDMIAFKYAMIAFSMNKAAGHVQLGQDGKPVTMGNQFLYTNDRAIKAEDIRASQNKLAGEVTSIFNKITEISAYERDQTSPLDIFD